MKEIKQTKQGYYYAEVTRDECLQWGGFGICDTCNAEFHKGYLVHVLNSCVCEHCFKDWESRTKVYPEDLQFQKEYARAWFTYHLGPVKLPENK